MAGPALKYLASQASTTASVLFYTVPAATSTVISKLVITNTNASAQTVFVSVVLSGGTCAAKNSVLNAVTVAGNDFIEVAQGFTLAAGDFICISASATLVNFNLFGQENS